MSYANWDVLKIVDLAYVRNGVKIIDLMQNYEVKGKISLASNMLSD